jgi:hypothetical protein
VLSRSLGLLVLALQHEEAHRSGCPDVAIADRRFRTPPPAWLRVVRGLQADNRRFWLDQSVSDLFSEWQLADMA